MDPIQLGQVTAATIKGFVSVAMMAAALVAANTDSINPNLQTIGLVIGILATSLTVVNLSLTLKERWTKSRKYQRH